MPLPDGPNGKPAGPERSFAAVGDTAEAWQASGQLLNLISLATFNETDGMVHCALPANPSQGRVQLRVAHNAQQYAPSPLDFDLYKPLPSFLLSPSSGPAAADVMVEAEEHV